jgi:O-antigen ligase
MLNKTAQPGNKPSSLLAAIFIASCLGLFIHGVTSSLLLQATNCSQLGRIVDILAIISLLGLSTLIVTRQNILSTIRSSRRLQILFGLLVTYTGWIIIRGLTTQANFKSVLLALLIDTSYFWLFFLLVAARPLKGRATNSLLIRLSIVLGLFALLASALYMFGWHAKLDSSLGYGQCGSEAVLRVSGATGWLRSRGFARNPNELGAILIIPLLVCLAAIPKKLFSKNSRYLLGLSLIGITSLLAVTFSRSAWIAAAVGAAIFAILQPASLGLVAKYKKPLFIVASLLLIILAFALRQSNFTNEFILHKGISSNSTSQHLAAKRAGLSYTWNHPWGTGPGSAGAVGGALHLHQSIETESAYLDIAAQYGFLGLALALALFVYCLSFVSKKSNPIKLAVLAGSIGLIVSGLIIPVWSNLTVSLLFAIFLALAATSEPL